MSRVNYKRLLKGLVRLFKDRFFLIVFVLFLIGFFLRTYRLYDFATFLGDQGRDVIILKRILSLEHLPAIGAPTSVGQVYLGPFYYYFMAPWLLLSRFDPIGPAFGVALLSSLFILLTYFLVKDISNRITALITVVLVTFSSYLIEYSRFSWNPNLLPYFSFLTVYFLIKALRTNKKIHFFLTGAFLSFSIQLHYLALFLILLVALSIIYNKKSFLINSTISFASFFFFSLPLLVFDLRHNFLNTKNFIKLYQQGGTIGSNKLVGFFDAFTTFNSYVFQTALNPAISAVVLIAIVLSAAVLFKKKSNVAVFFFAFILLFLGTGLYSGPKYPHYFASLYVVYFFMLAYLLPHLSETIYSKAILALFIFTFIFFNAQKYYFLSNTPPRQIEKAKTIAHKIYNNIDKDKFQVTGLPDKYSDSTYRYFLEIWGKRSFERDSLVRADELFVVCENDCKPIGDPMWDIAYFAPNKIVGDWKISGVRIYKLIR